MRGGGRASAIGAGLVAVMATACAFITDAGGLTSACPPDCTDAASDGSVDLLPDGGASARDGDAPASDVAVTDASGDGALDAFRDDSGCPGAHGPTMVRVTTFCIDSTEVTNAQYRDFLQAKAGDVSGQPARCAFNTSYAPGYGWPPGSGEDDWPVAGVDWCDATMYCKWAGKRLCGAIGGGALAAGETNDAKRSQWFAACTHDNDGLHPYPYGNTFDASTCNGGPSPRVPVGSKPGCVGGYPGVFDMSGNVAEWEDDCQEIDGGDPASDPCHARGGGLDESPAVLRCDSVFYPRRDYGIAGIGFRCCGP